MPEQQQQQQKTTPFSIMQSMWYINITSIVQPTIVPFNQCGFVSFGITICVHRTTGLNYTMTTLLFSFCNPCGTYIFYLISIV